MDVAKKLLGLICSPRKFGNSELFVKELYRQLPGAWELSLIRLPELDIRACRACYQCLFGAMQCPLDDDFGMVLEALTAADAYVVAAPTYLLGPNASLKGLLDRGLAFYAHLEQLWGKPAVGVAVAGIEGMEGYTKLGIESFVRLAFGELRGSTIIYGAIPGEIFLEKGGAAAARSLARVLVEGGRPDESPVPRCPLCGGDTFRFLGEGRLRCMLCSSSGQYEIKGEKLEVHLLPGEHPLFLTRQDAERHLQWLRGMKEKFLERRKELKMLTQCYLHTGTWLRSPKASVTDQ